MFETWMNEVDKILNANFEVSIDFASVKDWYTLYEYGDSPLDAVARVLEWDSNELIA
jgi:hypothetical protein